ncbi:MAG TPA: undecaprenyldiphospho-muramoylpentapeptide beta-N-acetylglucosaminyltransferase [Nitrospiraceae bacterium]|nr:undecaprenyldiphospho-muramoylpentapeptide beta-N-acetylglucosaminyltransferase [Nitrospiraceae bacterium]
MNVVVAAGGTGGHLYPAIAVAREFLRQDPATRVVFVGTSRGIESTVLAHEGFELELIAAKPLMGKRLWERVRALAVLPTSFGQSWRVLGKRQADLVIGVGGYTSPTVLLAALLRRIPSVILEPNAYPGLANRVVAPFARRIFLAFESTRRFFTQTTVRVVGMPVRRAFLEQRAAGEKRAMPGERHLLIFGGSQGAKAINAAMIEALPALRAIGGLRITHQTGTQDHERVAAAYREAGYETAEIVPFLYDMPAVLRSADLVVARAGGMTVAELTVCGKPAILIPLPTAIYNHQALNAAVMESVGAAVVLPQAELTGARLADTIAAILNDQDRLHSMSAGSAGIGRSDAAEAIVRECYDLMGRRHEINRRVGAV